jgi:hypothetical protein
MTGRRRAPRRPWTEVEIKLLHWGYADSLTEDIAQAIDRPAASVYRKANALGLAKSAQFLADIARERSMRPGHASQLHRFQQGHVPWCKGTKGAVGVQEGCRATQFKKGRPPEQARNYLPIGSHRVTHDGYLERKVTDDPTLVPARRWVPVHRLAWEAANGPIAEGHLVCFKPGMRTIDAELITVDRLECISLADNLRRNSLHRYGPEISKLIHLRGAITRQINKRSKEK